MQIYFNLDDLGIDAKIQRAKHFIFRRLEKKTSQEIERGVKGILGLSLHVEERAELDRENENDVEEHADHGQQADQTRARSLS